MNPSIIPANILIREYLAGDKHACLEAFRSNVPDFFTEAEIADFSNFLDDYPQLTKAPSNTVYEVVEYKGMVIGSGGFGKKEGNAHMTLAWGLIHKDYHKQGFGARLLEHRLSQFNRLFPNTSLYLDTTQHSSGFFGKYGFETLLITPHGYAPNMHRYDMCLHPSHTEY